MKNNTNINQILTSLIILSSIITALGLFFPITSISFGPYYGSIAKHIALSNNWTDLVLSNQDWLDKPHLPFWLSAYAMQIFGINSFAYILPGLIFHFIGAYYTYKLTLFLYNEHTTALLATLIYLTIFHLLFSAFDIRAEAFLLGQIIPAIYYWLHYDQQFSWRSLVLGALFTGLALMTKGIFVIITIVSGLVCWWIYAGELYNLIRPKWWLALALSFIIAAPEFLALYSQFDLHPEKIIFGHPGVSGLRWFFIDSQFGRFFGTGYIASTNPPPLHFLFYTYTFLWAFLPWVIIYPLAVYNNLSQFKQLNLSQKYSIILLLGYFWISFIMFSATSFQVDHYTNIIFPFAAISCAKYLRDSFTQNSKLFTSQLIIALILFVLTAIIAGLIFHGLMLVYFIILECGIILLAIRFWGEIPALKAIILSVLVTGLTFVLCLVANSIYARYDLGIQVTQQMNQQAQLAMVDFDCDSRSLEFYTTNPYYKVTGTQDNDKAKVINFNPQTQQLEFNQETNPSSLNNFYLLVSPEQWQKHQKVFDKYQLIAQFKANSPEAVLPKLIDLTKLNADLKIYRLFLVQN